MRHTNGAVVVLPFTLFGLFYVSSLPDLFVVLVIVFIVCFFVSCTGRVCSHVFWGLQQHRESLRSRLES